MEDGYIVKSDRLAWVEPCGTIVAQRQIGSAEPARDD
jgi:hypothetical protein